MPKKLTCPYCGELFTVAESRKAYYKETNGEGNFDFDFDGEYCCPNCTIESLGDSLSGDDWENYAMSVGYDFD